MAEHKHKMVNARFNLTEHEDHVKDLISCYEGYATWMMCDRKPCIHYRILRHHELIKTTTE